MACPTALTSVCVVFETVRIVLELWNAELPTRLATRSGTAATAVASPMPPGGTAAAAAAAGQSVGPLAAAAVEPLAETRPSIAAPMPTAVLGAAGEMINLAGDDAAPQQIRNDINEFHGVAALEKQFVDTALTAQENKLAKDRSTRQNSKAAKKLSAPPEVHFSYWRVALRLAPYTKCTSFFLLLHFFFHCCAFLFSLSRTSFFTVVHRRTASLHSNNIRPRCSQSRSICLALAR